MFERSPSAGVVVYDAALPGGFPDPAATFDVGTIDFLARGGDGYNFGGLPFTTLGVTYEQSMLNYLAGPTGRIDHRGAIPERGRHEGDPDGLRAPRIDGGWFPAALAAVCVVDVAGCYPEANSP